MRLQNARAAIATVAMLMSAQAYADRTWPVDGLAICRAPGIQDQIALASGPGGIAVVVWRDTRNTPADPADIYAQSFNATGDFLWAPGDTGIAICRVGSTQRSPTVALGPYDSSTARRRMLVDM